MKTLTLKYYQDPGHGWVRIAKDKLKELNIAHLISRYSYERNNVAFLEEDCDLGILFVTCDNQGIKIKLKDFHTNRQSKIRTYNHYTKD